MVPIPEREDLAGMARGQIRRAIATETIASDAGRRHVRLDRMDAGLLDSRTSRTPPNDQWVVPTIVQYELARWLMRESPTPPRTIAFKELDTVATKAADYAHKHGLAMADSIIYATAMDTGADLLTCDEHFAELPRVVYFAKAPR